MLKVENLVKSYETGNQIYPVLDQISLEVKKGEFVAVMGPSGSGKTTLLNCISCFIPYEKGKILLAGKDLTGLDENKLAKVRNKHLGFVFQDFMLLDGLSVFDNICLPQIISENNINQMEERANQICVSFGIDKIKDKYPAEISGGERQRTAVARALMNEPDLILADEPTGNLDSKSCKAVIDTFLQAQKEMHATILMVTHDSYAASFCDRVILLKDGKMSGQLLKNGSRKEFMDALLNEIRKIGGCEDE